MPNFSLKRTIFLIFGYSPFQDNFLIWRMKTAISKIFEIFKRFWRIFQKENYSRPPSINIKIFSVSFLFLKVYGLISQQNKSISIWKQIKLFKNWNLMSIYQNTSNLHYWENFLTSWPILDPSLEPSRHWRTL
jgi:hypothetical protein